MCDLCDLLDSAHFCIHDKQRKSSRKFCQSGATMQEVRHLVLAAEPDKWAALVLTGGACAAGALLLLLGKAYKRRQAKAKIMRARTRRDESLCRAEKAVLRYQESVRDVKKCQQYQYMQC